MLPLHVVLLLGLLPSSCASATDSLATSKQDSLYLAGIRQYSEAQYEKAIAMFLSSPPESLKASALFYTGLSYAALNDLQNAQRFLSEAVAKDSLNISFRFNMGQLLAREGAIDGAIDQYKRIVVLDTSFFPAYEQLGQLCELWQKETAQYRDTIWTRALDLRPRDYVALYYRGLSMFRNKQPDSGFVCLTRAVEEDSLFYAAVYELAVRNLARKNVDETFRWYAKAVQLRPTNPKVLSELATLFEKSGKRRAALPYALLAADLDTANATYAEQAGLLYFSLGKFDSAAMYLRKAAVLDGDNWSFRFNLALAYTQMDSTRLAVQAYKDAIEAFRLDDGANLHRRYAQFLSDKKNYAEAKKLYERALDIDPSNPETRYDLGWMYVNAGKPEAAITEFKKYLIATPADTSYTAMRKSVQNMIDYLNAHRKQ